MHQKQTAHSRRKGSFAHQLGKVDREVHSGSEEVLGVKFDEVRTDLKGTAVDVGHLVGRDDGISSRHHRTLICKFHRGMLLSHIRSAGDGD